MATQPTPTVIVESGGSYTVAQACAWLGCERHRLSRAVRDGQIRPITMGKARKFVGQDLLDLRQTLARSGGRPRMVAVTRQPLAKRNPQ